MDRLKHIELFAGCGGMTLGLESAGFELFMANELSPMAGETFAYNILGEDLQNSKIPLKTLWIKSQFERGNKLRLREDPNNARVGRYSDIENEFDPRGKLLIGDILQLNNLLSKNDRLLESIRMSQIDLVSGGPPCQSFSLAGRRDKNNNRNQLPWAFADFVALVKPKIVLLENVSGILRPFREDGNLYYAWFEVAKAFCLKDYLPICMHINAKYFGLPQNRPRYLMFAIRLDLVKSLIEKKDTLQESDRKILEKSYGFFEKVKLSNGLLNHDLEYSFYELNSTRDFGVFENSIFLPNPLCHVPDDFKTVAYGIDVLKDLDNDFEYTNIKDDEYSRKLDEKFKIKSDFNGAVKNHNHRKHSEKIQNRFRFLKLVESFENGDKNKLLHAIKFGSLADIDNRVREELIRKFKEAQISSTIDTFFNEHQTRKHSQRALLANKPAPAALSIPDDVCHYSPNHNRTLTVREMARIQSFPDWFEFRSKDTTGGKNRKFEVPNYTQVGNAVPPLLACELGKTVIKLLKSIE